MQKAFIFGIAMLIALKNLCWADPVATNDDFMGVTKQIQTWVDRGYYPGASMLVAKNGQIVYEKYFGNYDRDSVVYIASAGKWLAAATIAAVVDEGKLSWGDPVSKWLPEFTDVKGRATLRQLLAHTSGFADYQPKQRHKDDYQTLAESVAHIVDLPADAEPGERFKYGGLAMQVAGRMAEIAEGCDWETLFERKIGGPLGMAGTHFTPVDSAPGHSPMLGGGARSRLHDYANFLAMIQARGEFGGRRVLSADSIREMQADQVRSAVVQPNEFVERARGLKHRGIYGLGEWREILDAEGNATLISSPSWAGAYPWIDKKRNIYGIFLAHVDGASAAKDGFNAFYASPVLPVMVGKAIDDSSRNELP